MKTKKLLSFILIFAFIFSVAIISSANITVNEITSGLPYSSQWGFGDGLAVVENTDGTMSILEITETDSVIADTEQLPNLPPEQPQNDNNSPTDLSEQTALMMLIRTGLIVSVCVIFILTVKKAVDKKKKI
jgi:hypothetical protein